MIGLFGIHRRDSGAPVDLAPLVRRVRAGYGVHAPQAAGCSIGRAAHRHDNGHGVLADAGTGIVVVALGEIFNTEAFLGEPDPRHDPAPVVLDLYCNGRLDRLAEANGQFCAAVYDPGRHRLTLVTDRHALFPLHVWRSGEETVFGTSIYVLLGCERVPRKANPDALAQLFTMQRTVGRFTSVAGVDALPAACIWEIDREGVRERRYWELRWRAPDFSERDAGPELDRAFRSAVERQSGGKRVGLLLSGGIDSRWVLGATPRGALSCWTTASFPDNPELALAREAAAICGAPHRTAIVDPEDTLSAHDDAVIDGNGLFPASPQFSAFMPRVASECDTVLSGHGLDYTLRGYYLPARFLDIGGSHTRLPMLRPIPARPTGADVLYNLRQGPPASTLRRLIAAPWTERWWRSQESTMQDVLAPWLESDDPYNAWDAFILHAVSKHYAYTGMMSVRAFANLRMPAYDAEVFDVYLRMKPAWRCSARPVIAALRVLSPELARLENANTHFAADREPWLDVAALVGRGALRRLGILRRPDVPSSLHSAGSWQNVRGLYSDGPAHRARFADIKTRLDALTFGLLDAAALRICIDEHLEGGIKHTKLLRQLLTHDAWMRHFGIAGHV
ncbi:MAG: hypothetical protein FJX62_02980 [Alphaproteobacteria bacterium]|nr:hypothetical protein [Alphaproteobacteria bacterium]